MAASQPISVSQLEIGERVKELELEYRRLMILRILSEASGYSVQDDMLHEVLIEFSHHISFDRLHTDLAWLEEQDVVKLKHDLIGKKKICVATLTQRGGDVAYGRALVPGIKRPDMEK